MRHLLLLVLVVVLLVPALHAAAGEETGFEPPPELDVRTLLSPELRHGEAHDVEGPVEHRGFLAHFRLTSRFGTYEVTSRRLLEIRAHEVETLSRVVHTKGAPEALRSLGAALAEIPTGAVEIVLHPLASAERLGRGVGKTFRRLGDALRGRSRSPYEDSAGETAFSGDQKRQLADALNLDVYSTNPQVQAFLDRVGRARAAGTLTVDVASFALPVVGFVAVTVSGWQADVRRLLRDRTPAELERHNAALLREIGIPTAEIRSFLLHDALSPRHETVIAHAARRLGSAEGVAAILAAARTATSEVGALYQEQQAVLLAAHPPGEIVRLECVFHVVLARNAKGAVIGYLPYDSVHATPEWSQLLDALAGAAVAREAEERTLYVTGIVTPRARDAAADRGYAIVASHEPDAAAEAD